MRFRHQWTQPDPRGPIPELAPWVYAASRPFADWYFGDPDVAAEITSEWMGRPSAEVYAGRAIVMTSEEGEPAGCLIGIAGTQLAACRAADFAAFCADLGTGPEAEEVLEQVLPVSRELFPPVADDHLYISRVAVDPARQGQGLGKIMLAHALQTYREQGFGTFRLDVSAENRAAIRLYQAAGFQITSTSRSATADLTYCAMTLG